MRVRRLIVALGAAFLVWTGFRPGALPYTPGARFSDAATSHWGAALFLQRSAAGEGMFPLWRETILGGQPFAANPLNKTAYPLQWLALILPPALHLDVMIAAHLLIAGVGMWIWARSLDLSEGAAGLSALAYAFAPRTIAHIGAGHVDLLYALAWLPFLMWAARWAARGSWRGVWGAGLFAGLLFLADTRLSLFALTLAAAYVVHELWQTRRAAVLPALRVRLWRFIPSLIGFALIAGAVLVPLVLWQPYLTRAALTPADAGVFSLEPAHFLGLIVPQHGGNVETLASVGVGVLLLALIALALDPRQHRFWIGAAGIAGLYALGANGFLWSMLVEVAPILLWFRVPARAWLVVVLIAALLAGYGLQALLDRWTEGLDRARIKRLRRLIVVWLALVLVLSAAALTILPVPLTAAISLFVGGIGMSVLAWIALSGRLRVEVFFAAAIILTFCDLALTGRAWLEWRGEDAWLPESQRALAERLIAEGVDRLYSPTYSLEQQVAAVYDLRLFYGVDPFQLRTNVESIRQGAGITSAGYSVVEPPLVGMVGDDPATANRDAQPDTEMLAARSVSHVAAAYPLDSPRLRHLDAIGGVYLYENLDYAPDVLPRESVPLDVRAEFDRWTVAAALVSFASLIAGCFLFVINTRAET